MRALYVVALVASMALGGCFWGGPGADGPPQESEADTNDSNETTTVATTTDATATDTTPSAPTPDSPSPAASPQTPPSPEPTTASAPTLPSPPPPAPSTPPPAPPPAPTATPAAWPHEGSYVRYTMSAGKSFTGSEQRWDAYANASWSYHNGDWVGSCDGQVYDHRDPTTWNNTTVHRDYTAANPPHWPPFDTRSPPAVGQPVATWFLATCNIANETHAYAGSDATTYRAADGSMPYAFSTTWSKATGLVLSWSSTRSGLAPTHNVGQLVATDAPTG